MGPILLLGMMLGLVGVLVFGIFFLAGERARWRPWLVRSAWLAAGCLVLFVVASVGLR